MECEKHGYYVPVTKEHNCPDCLAELKNKAMPNLEEDIAKSSVDCRVMCFAKPTINGVDYKKWLADNKFYAESDDTKLDRRILENYYDVVEQFINSPESKATKAVFEIATQTVKKYLTEQNT